MLITEVQKNSKERIRVSIVEYHGRTFVDCRVHYEDKSGEWLPTRKGIALSGNCIDEVIQGLQTAGRKLEETPSSRTDTPKSKPKADAPALSAPVLNMLRTLAGGTMTRKALAERMGVSDKSVTRYIDQAAKGGYVQVQGRGPEQRITVVELLDKSDTTDSPELSNCPDAEDCTGETVISKEEKIC